ncbi:MAG: amidohydrolase [Rhodospirillales bacterium]|nr:amidohydrolase [Rhodospirillales bacterium]
MQGKIGLEEHFAIEDTIEDSNGFLDPGIWPELKSRLLDVQGKRIGFMDQYEVEMMILSLNAPAIQAISDTARATEIAIKSNDILAEEVAKNPKRFQALAALPMQDPEAAALELQRCVKDLGFVGALVNGFSELEEENSAVYYDLKQYWPFWKVVEELDVPFYLHPRNPLPIDSRIYDGHPWLMGPTWAFAQETAVHALRLICSGLFDEYPKIQIILGHMGEGIPFNLWRIDNRNGWVKAPPTYPAKRLVADYIQENFHITTSGNFRTQTLIDTLLEVGADRILFSTDYPFEGVEDAALWFDDASISEADRLKIGRTNAQKLFKLD